MGAIHKPRKFQFREIQNREIQEVAVCTLQGTRVTQGNSAIFTGNKFGFSNFYRGINLQCTLLPSPKRQSRYEFIPK